MNNNPKNIQSVQRAIDIINCVAEAERKISLKEISSILGLNINTTRGLAQTLLANGFLSKDVEQGTYTLGYEFLTKSKLVYQLQIQRIRDIAHPYMKQLSEKYGVSSWLQISFYKDIYTVETLDAPSTSYYSYTPKSGAKLPLHASASGKLYIAYMPEAEREKLINNINLEQLTEHTITDRQEFRKTIQKVFFQGYATELEEIDMGISSIAVPLFDMRGTLSGTISTAVPSAKLNQIFNNILSDLKRISMLITDGISNRRRL